MSLFLALLRCFSSRTYLSLAGVTAHERDRVSPFGHRRFNACTRLGGAFRSVPRPSSATGGQASPGCSCSLRSRAPKNSILSRVNSVCVYAFVKLPRSCLPRPSLSRDARRTRSHHRQKQPGIPGCHDTSPRYRFPSYTLVSRPPRSSIVFVLLALATDYSTAPARRRQPRLEMRGLEPRPYALQRRRSPN